MLDFTAADQYLAHFPAGSSKIIWWIMENRREYFDRSKDMLSRVKMLAFLSESQSKRWLTWCEEEHIHLTTQPMIVPLSLNDELAFVAGIPCSLNTPAFSTESMLEKRNILRAAVRKEMGLGDNDMLVMSLSSINPTKGQRLFLESALLVAEHNVSLEVFEKNTSFAENFPVVTHQNKTIITVELNSSSISQSNKQDNVQQGNTASAASKKRRRKHTKLANILSSGNHTSNSLTRGDQRKLRNLLSDSKGQENQHLKVLGTDAGGTREIVENKVTGLLHPVGWQGIQVLGQNIQYLLSNPSARNKMGMLGRKKVQEKYLKNHMYNRFAKVLAKETEGDGNAESWAPPVDAPITCAVAEYPKPPPSGFHRGLLLPGDTQPVDLPRLNPPDVGPSLSSTRSVDRAAPSFTFRKPGARFLRGPRPYVARVPLPSP
ncbi:hypothetical protein GW17_00046621, partial [Ensete ventricosum]